MEGHWAGQSKTTLVLLNMFTLICCCRSCDYLVLTNYSALSKDSKPMKLYFFKKNGPSSTSFSFISGLFQTNNTNFTPNLCEKCPSSIWRWGSNSQPSDYESSPLTTRQGSRPWYSKICLWRKFLFGQFWFVQSGIPFSICLSVLFTTKATLRMLMRKR